MQNSPKVGISHVFKYFWIAIKPQKKAFYYTVISSTLANIITVAVPLFYKKFFDVLTIDQDKQYLVSELTKIIFIILVINVIAWFFRRTSILTINKLVANTMARLRQMSFEYMLRHSHTFFTNNFTGSLTQKIGRFSRAFDRLIDMFVFSVLPLTIHVIGSLIVVYIQEPTIAYIMIGWMMVVFISSFIFQKWKLKYDLLMTKADSTTSAALSDSISNQNTVMSFARFNKEYSYFKNISEDQAQKQIHSWNLGAIRVAIQGVLTIIVEFVIFYYAIRYWSLNIISIGTFVLIQTYILDLAERMWSFGNIIRDIYQGFTDSKEMVEILETPYEVKDIPNAKELQVKNGEIEFKEVSFAFNETRNVLDKINLKIKAGEKVALIGPSGAGKSTTIKLLLRMYDLASGAIEIDGQNIKDVTQDSLRKNISLVPQDPILFHRTLMENIKYGREDATDEEAIEAAKLAHCDEFIDVLPLKYETFVGERGIKLSGGERQRVAIARAILKNAPILVLDEATSSLDSHSESLIQDALDKLMRGKTVVVIAHRLSTIRKMDRVIVIDDGKITEEGSHDELLSRNESLYKKLWNLQAGGFLQE